MKKGHGSCGLVPGTNSELGLVVCTCVENRDVTLKGEKVRGDAHSSTVCTIDHKVVDLEHGKLFQTGSAVLLPMEEFSRLPSR